MNEFMLYTLTYLFSQALGIYSIYKLVRAFFEECIVKRCVEVSAFVGYYILSSLIYLILNIPIANFAVNIISVFLLTFMYSSSIKKKLLVDVLAYIFMAGAETLVVSLTGHLNFSIVERNDYNSIFGIVVINILKYVVSMMVSGFKNIKSGNTLSLVYWVSLLIMPISSLFMLVLIFQSAGIAIYKITLSVAAVLIINFTVFFLFDRLAKSYQEKQEKEFVEQTGVRVIIGKGGMGPNTECACKNFKAIHCVFPAGCAVVAATHVERIVEAQWRDLGMPETLWHCEVNELGPLIVSIDPDGRNLFEENKVTFNEKKDKALEEIYPQVSFIK